MNNTRKPSEIFSELSIEIPEVEETGGQKTARSITLDNDILINTEDISSVAAESRLD